MKNVINYGTPQHNNDRDKNAQTIPRRTMAFLGTWPGRQHCPSHPMSHPQPTTSTPEAPMCQLSINQLQKTFLNYTVVQNTQLPDKLKFLLIKFSSSVSVNRMVTVMRLQRVYCGIWNEILGAFAKLREATINTVKYVCPSVHPQGTTLLPLDRFLWNMILEHCLKICLENSSFVKIGQE
jgi:hypothetical protein